MSAFLKDRGSDERRTQNLEAQLAYQKRLNTIITRIHSARDTNDILLNLQGEILSLLDKKFQIIGGFMICMAMFMSGCKIMSLIIELILTHHQMDLLGWVYGLGIKL